MRSALTTAQSLLQQVLKKVSLKVSFSLIGVKLAANKAHKSAKSRKEKFFGFSLSFPPLRLAVSPVSRWDFFLTATYSQTLIFALDYFIFTYLP